MKITMDIPTEKSIIDFVKEYNISVHIELKKFETFHYGKQYSYCIHLNNLYKYRILDSHVQAESNSTNFIDSTSSHNLLIQACSKLQDNMEDNCHFYKYCGKKYFIFNSFKKLPKFTFTNAYEFAHSLHEQIEKNKKYNEEFEKTMANLI